MSNQIWTDRTMCTSNIDSYPIEWNIIMKIFRTYSVNKKYKKIINTRAPGWSSNSNKKEYDPLYRVKMATILALVVTVIDGHY